MIRSFVETEESEMSTPPTEVDSGSTNKLIVTRSGLEDDLEITVVLEASSGNDDLADIDRVTINLLVEPESTSVGVHRLTGHLRTLSQHPAG